ncbi:MAG: helix-turn-helix domain-containing protein [Syntrophomonadaceae bacterium]|nr:helix-turn-helix domain-containing protein [Syntrophomonadaceae bacterium]
MGRVRNRLKYWRHRHQMNQTEFAQLLGLQQQQYNRYERQTIQPTLVTALIIAAKIKQPVEEIFYIEEYALGD